MNHFAYPSAVFLLLLPLIFRYLFPAVKGLHGDALKIPFIADLQKITVKSGGVWGSQLGKKSSTAALWILYLIYILLVLAAARPQWVGEPIPIRSQSRDIMLIMDISNSMLEPDFAVGNRRINRLAAVKKTASDFIDKRTDDRIGLILFGTRAYLQAPLTYDKKSVQDILWSMDAGMAGNSTSIGDAIGLALKNIKEDDHKEKILVLLTDGENNDGSLAFIGVQRAPIPQPQTAFRSPTGDPRGDALASRRMSLRRRRTFLGQPAASARQSRHCTVPHARDPLESYRQRLGGESESGRVFPLGRGIRSHRSRLRAAVGVRYGQRRVGFGTQEPLLRRLLV